jgi:hypothetical protein
MTEQELKYHRKIAVDNLYFRKEGKDYWRAELNIINQELYGKTDKTRS